LDCLSFQFEAWYHYKCLVTSLSFSDIQICTDSLQTSFLVCNLQTLPISLFFVKDASNLNHLKYHQVLLETDLPLLRSFPKPLLQTHHETSLCFESISQEVLHTLLLVHGSVFPFQSKVYSHQRNKPR